MKDDSETEAPELARRSLMRDAAMLAGAAALSTALPARLLSAATATATATAAATATPATPAGTQPRFSEEFLGNAVFRDQALNFDPPAAARIDGALLQTGAFVQPNGDIRFRIHAPLAQDVTLKFDLVRTGELRLTKQDNGVFEALLAYDDNHTGPMTVDVYVDGMMFLYPYMPIHWSGSRPHNFVEVPDAEMDFMFICDVPHGTMSREIYWVEPIKSWERCVVYTPPGYMKSNQSYPVLYLQHGGGENEVVWGYCGKVAAILDNLIAAGKARPLMVVMNNDMLRYGNNTTDVIDDAFERLLLNSCIPFIEKTYRVRPGKWNRALAGLSMGSMMSCDIAFRHPEVFGNLGTFTASMTHETFRTTYERPFRAVMQDPLKFARDYRVYFRSTTPQEDHYGDYFIADDKLCAAAGIDRLPGYHRVLYPMRTSKWNSWRLGLRDYAQLLFR